MNPVVQKYLGRHAEAEISLLADFPEQSWKFCLNVPAFNEQPAFLHRLTSLLNSRSCLAIVVVNRPDNREDTGENQVFLNAARGMGESVWRQRHLTLIQLPQTTSALLLIDRTSRWPLPNQQGVGLARKIAADIALSLIENGQVNVPWIFCTDADTHLPPGYFDAIINTDAAACIYPFEHLWGNDSLGQATRLYERSLRHYVDGLKMAGSPYAFHTIGSTLAINASTYAAVRGFPKRAGGEDFYILNKLAKVGRVESLPGPVIEIEARTSARAPFGTGPAVSRILAMDDPEIDFTLYNPAIFEQLKCWIDLIPTLWVTQEDFSSIREETKEALNWIGVEKAISHSHQHSKGQETFVRHMHTWFDAFLTLKFVHRLQATTYPAVSFRTVYPG